MINRLKYTEEEKQRLRQLKESTGDWIVEQKDLKEIDLVRQEIYKVMNQMTEDNFNSLKDKLVKHLGQQESAELLVQLLIEKALNEKLFTVLYCRLIQYLNEKKITIKDQPEISFKKLVSLRLNELNDFGFSSMAQLKEEQLTKEYSSEELKFEEINFKR